jgi:hypothetical protein
MHPIENTVLSSLVIVQICVHWSVRECQAWRRRQVHTLYCNTITVHHSLTENIIEIQLQNTFRHPIQTQGYIAEPMAQTN